MRRLLLYVLHFTFYVGFCQTAFAQLPPTMGWSSWNTFALNINEDVIKGQALAMVSTGLKAAGYKYINIDDGYFYNRNETTGALLIHPQKFPKGLRPIVDYIHSLGLKAGIYSDAGVNTCGSWGNPDRSGRGVGLYGHDKQDLDMFFSDLNFDFIKVDYCGGNWGEKGQELYLDERERYTAISKTMKDTRRPDAILNVCRWAYPGTWVKDVALSWRTTYDIRDEWKSVKGILAENLYLAAYSGPGHYNDMDMLEVGRRMSAEEDRTHFGLWCIMNSPLLIGCDMANVRPDALELMKNRDLISINQDKTFQQAYLVKRSNECYILVRDVEMLNGVKRVFAIYNPNDDERFVTVNFQDLDLAGKVSLRDCFEQKEIGEFYGGFQISVPAHGTRIYKATGEQRLERIRYEAETAYISDYQEIRNNQEAKTGIYTSDNACSSGYKATWLGMSEKNDLVWDNVYTEKGGKRTLTIAFISGNERNVTVSVNGKEVKQLSVTSGGWDKIGRVSVPIKLKKGRNVIRLSNANDWMPDIDYIEIKK